MVETCFPCCQIQYIPDTTRHFRDLELATCSKLTIIHAGDVKRNPITASEGQHRGLARGGKNVNDQLWVKIRARLFRLFPFEFLLYTVKQ